MTTTRHPKHYLAQRVGAGPRQRVAAIAAITADLLAILLLGLGVLARPLYAFAVLVCAVLFLGAVFLALTSAGLRRRLAVVAAVLLLVLVVVSIFWNPDTGRAGWQGPVTLGLFVLGAVLSKYALQVPPPMGFELFQVTGTRTTTHPVLLMNLHSGGGKAEQFDLRGMCLALGIEPVILERGVDLADLARDAVARGADALGMAGGDGSLAVVAAVAAEHDLPFVCIPAGTRNHFALDIGLDRNDPRHALASFVNGEARTIDYATVNDRMFLNNVSAGLYAAIVEQDSYRDTKVETTLQLLPELWAEGGPWFDLHFDVPEHERLEQAALLQVSNNPYGKEMGRRDRLDGGELGMITADPKRVGDLVGITLLAAAGQAERASALWMWSAPTFRVESGQAQLSIGIDGETVSMATPLEFRSVPGGLRLLVPEGARMGLAEQHRGVEGTFSALFDVAFGRDEPER